MADSNRELTFDKNKPKYVLTLESKDSIVEDLNVTAMCNKYIDELKINDVIDLEGSWIIKGLDNDTSVTKNILQVFFQTTEAQNAIIETHNSITNITFDIVIDPDEHFIKLKTILKKLLTAYIEKEKEKILSEESSAGGKKLRKRKTNNKRSNTRKINKRKRSTNKRRRSNHSKRKRSNHSNTNKKRSTRRK